VEIGEEYLYTTHNENETQKIGERFGEMIQSGDVIVFEGELGAGKTEFIRGICKWFEAEDVVTSPTFSLINIYESDEVDFLIYHIDLYRIEKPSELTQIGFDDIIADSSSVKLIEWYQNAGSRLQDFNYKVSLSLVEENMEERTIRIERMA